MTLITAVVITSRAVRPALASRSYSLTNPTTAPVSSTTGTALIRCRPKVSAISLVGMPGDTVTTGVVMISPARAAAAVPAVTEVVRSVTRAVYDPASQRNAPQECRGDEHEAGRELDRTTMIKLYRKQRPGRIQSKQAARTIAALLALPARVIRHRCGKDNRLSMGSASG